MNRRGFLGLLGKLAVVGQALGVAPALLEPLQPKAERLWTYVDAHGWEMRDERNRVVASGPGPVFALAD